MTPDYGEPWRLFPPKAILTSDGRLALAPGPRRARLVACVNACVGMADPTAELAALRAERDRLREALEPFARYADDWGDRGAVTLPLSLCAAARAALRGPPPAEAP